MSKLNILLLIILLALLSTSCEDKKQSLADMIIYSDQIYTGTDDISPQAVIITDGVIMALTMIQKSLMLKDHSLCQA